MAESGSTETIREMSQDGADISSPGAMPAGGWGIRGWLSAIYTQMFAPSDFMLEVSRGNISDHSPLNKFARGTVAGAADETVWDGSILTGVTGYTYMAGGDTLYISSDNDGDDQIYRVYGSSATGAHQTVDVTANGKTFVALSGTWDAVWRAKNIGVTDNAGNIYISDDNTDVGGNGIPDTITAIKAMITIGFNQTLMSVYRVPLDSKLYLGSWYSSMGKNDDAEVTLWIRENGGVFQIKDHQDIYQGPFVRPFNPPLEVLALSDIEIRGHIGSSGGEVSCGYNGILIAD